MSAVSIQAVESKKQMNDFLLLPWDVYENDPTWIPPLLMAVKKSLDTKNNPFFKHATLKLWNAYKDGKCVGRIAGIVDENHNKFHEEKTGFWGFFESVNDQEVADQLFNTVSDWVKAQGMQTLRGPMSPSTNHECGLQISAFDTKPFIMMTQNPPYYPELVEKAGFAKAKDLLAWYVHKDLPYDEKLVKYAKRVSSKEDIKIRSLDIKKFDEEIEKILDVYNDAWEKNWGFVPMTDEEFRHMAHDLKPICVPQLIFIVEVKGETAGFGIFLPDLNQVMEKITDGKLFPTGLFKFLWYTKVKRIVNRGRVVTLGVKKKFRHLGLASMIYMAYFKYGVKAGFDSAECSWILEDNSAMNAGLKLMKAEQYKTYRIYDRAVN